MAVGLEYPHINKEEGHPAHLERLPRVRVAQIVMDYLAHGWSPDEMCRQHTYLNLAEVHAAMAYYYDHQEEVDAEIRGEVDQATQEKRQAPPSPFATRMHAKGLW